MHSLRARLVLVLSALVAVASLTATSVAYAATDHQLFAQLDGSLAQAAAQFSANPNGGGPATAGLRPDAPGGPARSGPPPSTPGGAANARPPNLFQLVVAQRLGPGGRLLTRYGSVSLPVDALDRAIAGAGAGQALRTASVDGTPYRVFTLGTRGGAVQVAQSLGQVDGVLGSLRWRLGLLALILVLLAGVGGLVFARRITTPLESLTRTAEQVAGSGSLVASVPTTGQDEVGRLGRAFASMLSALQTSRAQQHQLVRDAGHELRTPLTSLRANVDLLRRHRGDLPADALQRLLDDLDTELRELSGLMDEVVELATDSRDEEPAVSTDVSELVTHVVERGRSRLNREIALRTEPWRTTAAPRALERAVANLLENAAKFSPADQPIEVTAAAGAITVRDHGPGVPERDLPHIFDRFYRAESARSLPGSGLGLAIVRHIVEDHGGSVAAENLPDGGASVTIRLP